MFHNTVLDMVNKQLSSNRSESSELLIIIEATTGHNPEPDQSSSRPWSLLLHDPI
jgi:hypothetical protein